MKIALIGATGYVGAKLLAEALDRGHQVTAVVSDAAKLPGHSALTGVSADATDVDALAELVAGHDLVISSYNPGRDSTGTGTQAITDGVKRGGVARFLVVGGAGSLKLPSGERVVDQPDFPAGWKEGALRTSAFLDRLRGEDELDWVFLSPATMLVPGERTGHYRTGKDDLLTDGAGESRISLEDYAVAMLDEAERPLHHRERFTVAY
jgi:putative NADH-flavin reductase